MFFVLAVMGKASLWMAVFADMGASLIVVANGLRLLKSASDENAMPATLTGGDRTAAAEHNSVLR